MIDTYMLRTFFFFMNLILYMVQKPPSSSLLSSPLTPREQRLLRKSLNKAKVPESPVLGNFCSFLPGSPSSSRLSIQLSIILGPKPNLW